MREAMAGVAQRSSRSALTVAAIAIGIGSFVAVLGVTSSANGQISRDFDAVTETQVAVRPVNDVAHPGRRIPTTAEEDVARIMGVEAVGSSWGIAVDTVTTIQGYDMDGRTQSQVLAASAGYWNVVQPTIARGRVFDIALQDMPVAVVGEQVARTLRLLDVEYAPTIFINATPFTVIGVVSDTVGGSAPLSAVTIPAEYARQVFGEPGSQETLTVDTALGASSVVADQLALALNPREPAALQIIEPAPPTVVRGNVSDSVTALFLALAVVCLIVGAIGVSNASLMAVMARVPEIGLRRSLGARPSHIMTQFLLEASIRGFLGGSIGASIALILVAVIAVAQQWTAVVQPWTVVAAPVVGALVGLLAGAYPAARASRIQPIEAIRRH